MLKIRLFCANGMSTSLLVKKMEEAAKEKGKEVDHDSGTGHCAPGNGRCLRVGKTGHHDRTGLRGLRRRIFASSAPSPLLHLEAGPD